jgi:hypothetical protein
LQIGRLAHPRNNIQSILFATTAPPWGVCLFGDVHAQPNDIRHPRPWLSLRAREANLPPLSAQRSPTPPSIDQQRPRPRPVGRTGRRVTAPLSLRAAGACTHRLDHHAYRRGALAPSSDERSRQKGTKPRRAPPIATSYHMILRSTTGRGVYVG